MKLDDATRLAAYERMHTAVLAQYETYAAQVDERKAAGRLRGTTGNQLLAQKLMFKNMLGLYELYDIPKPDAKQ